MRKFEKKSFGKTSFDSETNTEIGPWFRCHIVRIQGKKERKKKSCQEQSLALGILMFEQSHYIEVAKQGIIELIIGLM